MTSVGKWIERVYSETDFGRSVATSLSGIVGLSVYLVFGDWVIAVFSTVIAFPIFRLIASGLYEKAKRWAEVRVKKDEAKHLYERLSQEEKEVVSAFVREGGCVLTWSQVNRLSLPASGVESLIQRGVLGTSMTADGMRETFVLDSAVFDVGQEQSPNENS